jgi:UDP-N-acetylglucosamine kinase
LNKINEQIELEAINYLKKTKNRFFEFYLGNCEPLETKTAIFTAGASGSGKTEFAEYILELEHNLIHLDIHSIREYFIPLDYNGSNSKLFQKPSSWGVHFLFDEAVKKKNLSIIMDSNFSSLELAKRNIKSLLKRGYNIEVYYIYDDLKKCFLYTKKREAITKRTVPEDVFFNSVIKSRETVIKIKNEYKENIILNLIDKTTNEEYSNISVKEFEKVIPVFKGEF